MSKHHVSRCLPHWHNGCWVRTVALTSDQGSDQTIARQHVQSLLDPREQVILFEADCFHHLQSNSVKSALKLCDGFSDYWEFAHRYYCTVVKFINYYRSNLLKLQRVWRAKFPHDDASHIFKLPPKPCAPRWGTVQHAEEFIVALPARKILVVLDAVETLNKGRQKGKSKTVAKSHGPVDDVQIDESRQFSLRRSRWYSEMIAVAGQRNFLDLLGDRPLLQAAISSLAYPTANGTARRCIEQTSMQRRQAHTARNRRSHG